MCECVLIAMADDLWLPLGWRLRRPIVVSPLLFLLGLIAAAYSSADSALTSLTTSFSVDFLNVKEKKHGPVSSDDSIDSAKESIGDQEKVRKLVHIGMSILLIFVVVLLRYTTEDSAIWLLIKLAGFTYGPLIGLFFFGILSKRKLTDTLVPIVCVLVGGGMAIIWYLASNDMLIWIGDYKFGAELIIYNAILSFGALFLISRRDPEALN